LALLHGKNPKKCKIKIEKKCIQKFQFQMEIFISRFFFVFLDFSLSSYELWKRLSPVRISLQRSFDDSLELFLVCSQQARSFEVQGIVGVWLIEEEYGAIDDCVDVQNWIPIFSENVQANFPF